MYSLLAHISVLSLAVALGVVSPSGLLAQGVVLRPGSIFKAQFSSMSPGSHELQVTDRPVWEINGTLVLTRTDAPFSFLVELFGGGELTPVWSYRFNAPIGSFPTPTGTFGAADIGNLWPQRRGSIRLTFLSGPAVALTDLIVYQSFPVGGIYRSYEAVLPVPEPPLWALIGLAAAIAFGYSSRSAPRGRGRRAWVYRPHRA